jgi:hypothetical protein
LIYAASQAAEEAFKKTVEVDRLIDTLRDANPNEVSTWYFPGKIRRWCYANFVLLVSLHFR